jgi:hypothetical protein
LVYPIVLARFDGARATTDDVCKTKCGNTLIPC